MPKKNKIAATAQIPEKSLEERRADDIANRNYPLIGIIEEAFPKIPTSFHYRLDDAARVKNAFDFTFALIGGQPRFALWAAQNPTEFYKLYAKMVPATNNVLQTSGDIIFNTGATTGGLNKTAAITNVIDDDEDED